MKIKLIGISSIEKLGRSLNDPKLGFANIELPQGLQTLSDRDS